MTRSRPLRRRTRRSSEAGRGLRAGRAIRSLVIDVTPLRVSPRFRWLCVGQAATQIGRQCLVVAVPYQIFVLTRSTWLVGVAGLIQVVPLVACSILGGTLADAFDRARILFAVGALMALTSMGLALNTGGGAFIWLIMVLVAVDAGLTGIETPARTALIPSVVSREHVTASFAINTTVNQTVHMAGPALAGVVIAVLGLGPVYWVAVAAYLGAALSRLALGHQRVEGATGRVTGRATLEGWRYFRSVPVLQQLMLVDLSAMVFGLPRALFPVVGTVTLGGDASTVGLLHAAQRSGRWREGSPRVGCPACSDRGGRSSWPSSAMALPSSGSGFLAALTWRWAS